MTTVAILIGSHLSSSPRPLKEALALKACGYKVVLIGVWYESKLVHDDQELCKEYDLNFIPALDFRPRHKLKNFCTRLKHRLVRMIFHATGIVLPELYGYGVRELFREAIKLKADLTIVHSEAGLYVAKQLIEKGYKAGIDLEDWFSRDLPVSKRRGRPVADLEELEKFLLQSCTYAVVPSQSMATAIAQDYGVETPMVVFNTFYGSDLSKLDSNNKDRKKSEKISLHWFSHSIGAGRGLETLFAALKHIPTVVEVHLRGNASASSRAYFAKWIKDLSNHKIQFHERVPPDELLSRIAEHDICLALEPDDVQSTDLTISNKLFQYMLAGRCIVATKTKGQTEVMESWAAHEQLVAPGDVMQLAASLSHFITDEGARSSAGEKAQNIALQRYTYELQAQKICQRVEEALQS